MATIEAMTAAPLARGFTFNRQRYTPSMLTLSDFGEISEYLKARPLNAIKFQMRNMPKDEANFLLAYAYEQIEKALYDKISKEAFIAGINSVAGRGFALWLSLRQRHAELTLDNVERMVTPDNWDEVGMILDLAAGWGHLEKHPGPQHGPETVLGGEIPGPGQAVPVGEPAGDRPPDAPAD